MEDSKKKYLENCLKDLEKKGLIYAKGNIKKIVPSISKIIYLIVNDEIQNGLKFNLSISTIYLNCCRNEYFKKYITYYAFYGYLKKLNG